MRTAARPIVLVCLSAFGATLAAQTAPTQARFEGAWADARGATLPRGTHAVWTETTYPTMTQEEVDAALARIGKDPAHPERVHIESNKWLLEVGPHTTTLAFWYLDDEHFRVNEDLPKADWSPQIDAVVNGREGWVQGANGALTALDFNNTPPGVADSRTYRNRITGFNTEFVSSGLGRTASPYTVTGWSADGNAWRARIDMNNGKISFQITGGFSEEHDHIFLTRNEVVAAEEEKYIGNYTEYSGHHYNEQVGRFIPTTVEYKSASGQTERARSLVSLEPFDPDLFSSYAKVPTGDHKDPLRPDLALRRIDDFRPATAVRTEIDQTSGQAVTELLPDSRPARAGSEWRTAGWILAGVCVATLIGVRVYSTRK